MTETPFWLELLFGLTTLFSLILMLRSTLKTKPVLLIILLWLAITGIAALSGFTQATSLPPRMLFLALIAFAGIVLLFATKKGRTFIDGLDPAKLTLVHTVRIPVEIVLFLLFTFGTIPELMTFEGRNFDILSGLSAPLIYYFGYRKKSIGPKLLIIWNFICIGLLVNIVTHAILAAPFPFQQLAFDQPNRAVLYFPFVWLPVFIVPLVLFAHLVCLRNLFRKAVY
ncbi:MAG TPA: hypothetical protein DIW47_08215 [Bacteroidetes bacterium]|nr:hypothetical protein [Bacteroidota bacterium]